MSTQRLLLHEDSHNAQQEIKKLESFIPELQKLNEIFEGLDMGKLDEKTALSLLMDKGETVGEMFYSAIAADCMASGNKNRHFVNQQIKMQEPTVNNFKNEVKSLLEQFGTFFDFSKFSYSEGIGYYVSEESKKAIRESNKMYLEDKRDIEYYNAVKAVCDAMNTLNRLTIERTGYNHTKFSQNAFNTIGSVRNRFDAEVKVLESVINTTSENPEPDAKKVIQFTKKYKVV